MTEPVHFPKSAVTAQFHSVHQSIEFVVLEQDGKSITLNPEDCLSITMKVLDQRKGQIPVVTGNSIPPPEPDLDATKEGCQG